jgi:Rrf2 family cysteine metabolism transcriptional repressor
MISAKYQYGLEIMLCLSGASFEFPMNKSKIAERIGISTDYIEQIAKLLKAAGLMKSKRGLKGGFYLASDPSDISVQDIIKAQGGILFVGRARKPLESRRVWREADELLESHFSSITLEKLLEE